jgi:hypothetical protein
MSRLSLAGLAAGRIYSRSYREALSLLTSRIILPAHSRQPVGHNTCVPASEDIHRASALAGISVAS